MSITITMNTTTAYKLDGQDRWHMTKESAIKDYIREQARSASSSLLSYNHIDWILDNAEFILWLKKEI